MSINAKFITADRYICRHDGANEVQIRLISEDVIMYTNLDLKEMKNLRDFLDRSIDKFETSQG